MYLTIRQYASVRSLEEIGRRVREGLVPTLRRMPGFRAYYACETDGLGGSGAFSVAIFDGRERALEANEQTRGWVVANLRDLAPNPPEVTGGEVIHDVAAPKGGRDGYVAVHSFDGMGPLERVRPRVRDLAAPLVARQPGFRRFCALTSDAHGGGRGVAVSVFETRAAASAAQVEVLDGLADRMKDLFPNPPTAICGEVLVAAAA